MGNRWKQFKDGDIIAYTDEDLVVYLIFKEWIGEEEVDLIVVTKSGYVTEYEIKRSYSDFVADFAKDEAAHKAPWVYKFYYVVPLGIKEKVEIFLQNAGFTDDTPAILLYDESLKFFSGGGCPYVKGGRKMFLEEQLKLARLGVMRYWNLRDKQTNKN